MKRPPKRLRHHEAAYRHAADTLQQSLPEKLPPTHEFKFKYLGKSGRKQSLTFKLGQVEFSVELQIFTGTETITDTSHPLNNPPRIGRRLARYRRRLVQLQGKAAGDIPFRTFALLIASLSHEPR